MEHVQASRPLKKLWGILGLVLLVLGTAEYRIQRAQDDPSFERWHRAPEDTQLWKSDPALLAYFVERIADAGGGVPADWRADPRVGHPEGADIPAEFTVGQEWLVAWAWMAVGRDASLEFVSLVVSSLLAALAIVGAAWAALAWTGSWRWALVAGSLFALLPGNHRTLGFLLMREDLAWPLWSLHFGALAMALRTERVRDAVLAGVLLAGALATWHASRGFFSLEVALLLVMTGLGRFPRSLRWMVVPVLVASFLVPALHAGRFWLEGSLLALSLLSLLAWRWNEFLTQRRWVLGGVAFLWAGPLSGLLRTWLGAARGASFEHVEQVLSAKAAFRGLRPDDPSRVPFDARLLWQGPFEAVPVATLAQIVGYVILLALVALALWSWWKRTTPRRDLVLGAVVIAGAFLLSLTIGRTVLLLAWLVPVATAVLLSRTQHRRGLAVALLVAHGLAFRSWSSDLQLYWYTPAGKPTEYARLFEWVEANVPEEAGVACDFVNATSLLQATGRKIVLHPKYETQKSRDLARSFFEAFYQGTPADLRAWCLGHDVEHLWIDRYVLGFVAPWVGGVPKGESPAVSSAAATFLSQDAAVLNDVEGFELAYRSPETIQQMNGEPYDLFRWYRVVP